MSGERIKRILMFWDLTQHESVLKLKYEENNADVRIVQHKSCGYCVPKTTLYMGKAKVLNVNYIHFIGVGLVVPRILYLPSFGLMKMTAALFTYLSLSAIPANATLLMINQCVTMTMMIGLLMLQ